MSFYRKYFFSILSKKKVKSDKLELFTIFRI